MKKYLATMLVAGTLAIISMGYVVASQLQSVTTTIPPHSQQSSFYTTTASLGDANVTEILVDTSVQFPISGASSEWQTSNFLVFAAVAFLLFIAAIVVGMRPSRGSQFP